MYNKKGSMSSFAIKAVISSLAFVFVFILALDLNSSYSSAKTTKKDITPITLNYDGTSHEYNDIQGTLYFDHKDISLSTMPIIKIDSALYGPAEEILRDVFGFSYSYDASNGNVTATDDDAKLTLTFNTGGKSYTVTDKNGKTTTAKFTKAMRMVSKGSESPVLCIPVTKLFSVLGYTAKWTRSTQVFSVQRQKFFDWSVEKPAADTKNHIYSAVSKYELSYDSMGYLDFNFYGDLQTSYDQVTVDRNAQTITVTIPNSTYLPEKKVYERFGEIVKKMEISESDGSVKIIFDCENTTEFAYTTSNSDLHLRLMWDYSSSTGMVTNYSMSFLRPNSSYLASDVSIVECYDAINYAKTFKIVIKGDHVDFYNQNPVIINNNYVKSVSVSLSSGGNTVITVKTSTLRGFLINRIGEYFVAKIDAPKKVYKNILVFDQGHGGYDNGASHYKTHEKNLNLEMGYTLLKGYFSKIASDVHIFFTRRQDKFITLSTRSKFASKVGADAFISLHMNSASNKKANGTEVYYSTNNNKKSFSSITSSKMAHMMDSALVKAMGTEDRGVKTAGFYVIKRNTVPAILIELGFLSGNKDHVKLMDPAYQKTASKTIAKVIKQIFEKYPTGRN